MSRLKLLEFEGLSYLGLRHHPHSKFSYNKKNTLCEGSNLMWIVLHIDIWILRGPCEDLNYTVIPKKIRFTSGSNMLHGHAPKWVIRKSRVVFLPKMANRFLFTTTCQFSSGLS